MKKKMQIRIWGTSEENIEMIELLKSSLGEKVKIVSQPYPSVNGVTQCIFNVLEKICDRKVLIIMNHFDERYLVDSNYFDMQEVFEICSRLMLLNAIRIDDWWNFDMNDPDENEADSFLEQFSDSVDDAD
jgi:hypothetical protein